MVYEIELIKAGQFVPDTWGTITTWPVPGIGDNFGIDFDQDNGVLYHYDYNSDAVVVTDLNGNLVESFACPSPAGSNTGITYIEGKPEREVWVTDFNSNTTTRCVEQNRCLLISAQDYLFDRGLTSFMQDYLGVASYASNVGHTTVEGAGSVYSDLGPYGLVYPGGNFSDHLDPDATAEVAFTGDGGAGNAALDKYGATYFTTFMGYPYDAIPNLADRANVMAAFLAGCAGPFPDIDVSPPSLSSQQIPDTVVVEPFNIGNVGWADLDWMIVETGQTSASSTDPWVLEALENVSSSPEGALTLIDVVVDPSLMPAGDSAAGEPFEPVSPAALTYYASRSAFDTDFPGLPLEDFEEGNVGPGGIVPCPAPLDETNNDACFSPGDILPGILFQDDPGPDIDGLVLVGAGFNGNPSKQVLANYFVESFDIYFTTTDTYAAGMDLASQLNADTVQITIYGPRGVVLGNTTASATNAGEFWGVASDQYLTRIKIYSPADEAEGVDNIAFGGLPVCSAPVDIPWLNVNPTAGTTPPGGNTVVDVTFDSTGLVPGTYSGNLCVDNNDPDEPSINVPLTMTVIAPSPPDVSFTVTPTLLVDYPATFTNTSDPGQPPADEFLWDFGDGDSMIAGLEDVTHTYANTGAYTVTLFAENPIGDDTYTLVIDVIAEADLSITKVADPDPVSTGGDLAYTLTVSNFGPNDAMNVVVIDTLPAGVTFVSGSLGCTESGGVVNCDIGNLANGGSVDLNILVTAPDTAGTITNVAEVMSDANDPDMDNNTFSLDTSVEIGMVYLPFINKP